MFLATMNGSSNPFSAQATRSKTSRAVWVATRIMAVLIVRLLAAVIAFVSVARRDRWDGDAARQAC
jgi:hypothetical protein